ncbi:MAG: GNAT family N-acetyltransferase [Bacilli bacterium]|nr:GNAT family N-acetyltransferase [Bacilli bacterium]
MKEYYKMFKELFPYINREEGKHFEIICNENNEFFEEKTEDGKLVGFAIVNKNTILLLIVDKSYRNQGIGTKLLDKCEQSIISKGYDKVILGVGFDYLMPGVPTSEKYTNSCHENLDSLVNDNASSFFEKKGYHHSWGECNCFDMKMSLIKFVKNENSIGDIINGINYRWATINDLEGIIECSDDACQYQDEKFSKYYRNEKLYDESNNQRVLVAVKDNKIVGTLIISIETEGKDLGCVGCTCVSFKETHQGIGTNMVRLGTKYLKDIGLNNASLSYTYTGLDKLYGDSGYEISTYYFMGEKRLKK